MTELREVDSFKRAAVIEEGIFLCGDTVRMLRETKSDVSSDKEKDHSPFLSFSLNLEATAFTKFSSELQTYGYWLNLLQNFNVHSDY